MEAPTLLEACNSVASIMKSYPESSVEVKMEPGDNKCTIDLTVPNPGAPTLPLTLTTSLVKNGQCAADHLCLSQTLPGLNEPISAEFAKASSGELYLVMPK